MFLPKATLAPQGPSQACFAQLMGPGFRAGGWLPGSEVEMGWSPQSQAGCVASPCHTAFDCGVLVTARRVLSASSYFSPDREVHTQED